MPDGGARRDGPPSHEFVTAWEVDDASEEAVLTDDADHDEGSEPPKRSTADDDRYSVPWALPDA